MTISEQDSIAAFSELLATSGESLILWNGNRVLATVTASVNRNLDARALDKGQVDFSERDKTHVELLRCKIERAPEVGQYFKDCQGEYHRIQVVRKTDITYRCDCEVAAPDQTE